MPYGLVDVGTCRWGRAEAVRAHRRRGMCAAILVALTVALRLPAFLSTRHLVFDDGMYGVSVVDMRHGLAPYTGVFSAQGPLHFPLLYVGDLLGLRTINGPRVTPMLAGIAATIASWAIARRLAGNTAGVIAGVLVATSGSMIWTTGQVTGDGPASGLAVLAVWAAVAYRDDPRLRRALLAGVAIGATLAVKPLLFPPRSRSAGGCGRGDASTISRARSARPSRCGSRRRSRGDSGTCGGSRSPTTAAPARGTRSSASSASCCRRWGAAICWWSGPCCSRS